MSAYRAPYLRDDALDALEWGSCDGCGNHAYCAVCEQTRGDGHAEGCPVPHWIRQLDRPTRSGHSLEGTAVNGPIPVGQEADTA